MMRLQRGIAIEAVMYIIAALAVLGAGAYGVWAYTSAIKRAEALGAANKTLAANLETLSRANQDQLAENAMMRLRQAHTDKLLAERQTARAAAETTKRSIDDAINTALRARPESRAWADSPVPADVVASLRNAQPGAGGAGGENDPRAATARPAGGGRYPGLAREPD